MKEYQSLRAEIQEVEEESFDRIAFKVFDFQGHHNTVYRDYLALLDKSDATFSDLAAIPPLPISLFKQFTLKSGEWEPELTFTSSGTTGLNTSRHALKSRIWYETQATRAFEQFYGPVQDYCFLALLPAYLERKGSSLVFMANHFIEQSKYEQSGFFLYEYETVLQRLHYCKAHQIPTVLIGVSFALLDLVEFGQVTFPDLIVMETGGMKGRRKEITRTELHGILKAGFGVKSIHSEYGMTELLSQAYSKGNGLFYPAKSMKVLARDITDPFSLVPFGRTGQLQIIDLSNLDTISFIATEDLGRVYPDGSFEVLGRLDHSDLRGCNLLVE